MNTSKTFHEDFDVRLKKIVREIKWYYQVGLLGNKENGEYSTWLRLTTMSHPLMIEDTGLVFNVFEKDFESYDVPPGELKRIRSPSLEIVKRNKQKCMILGMMILAGVIGMFSIDCRSIVFFYLQESDFGKLPKVILRKIVNDHFPYVPEHQLFLKNSFFWKQYILLNSLDNESPISLTCTDFYRALSDRYQKNNFIEKVGLSRKNFVSFIVFTKSPGKYQNILSEMMIPKNVQYSIKTKKNHAKHHNAFPVLISGDLEHMVSVVDELVNTSKLMKDDDDEEEDDDELLLKPTVRFFGCNEEHLEYLSQLYHQNFTESENLCAFGNYCVIFSEQPSKVLRAMKIILELSKREN